MDKFVIKLPRKNITQENQVQVASLDNDDIDMMEINLTVDNHATTKDLPKQVQCQSSSVLCKKTINTVCQQNDNNIEIQQNDQDNEKPNESVNVTKAINSSTVKNKKRIQKYRPIWQEKFSWIIPLENNPFCKVCHKLLTNNINHIERHKNSLLHKKNVNALKNQPEITDDQTLENRTTMNQAKAAELKLIMFTMEHNLPFNLVDDLIKLVKSIFPDSKIAKHLKVGRTKVKETVTSLLQNEGIADLSIVLRKQPFSLIIDETTDVSSSKCLAIVVRYFNKTSGKVFDRFLSMLELKNCDAKTIYESIMNLLEKNKIPISNLIGFAADNASVMMGQKNGVQKMLKENNNSLYVIGCTCHSLHLCSSAAAKKLPQNVEILARNIYVFFAHSAKRQSEFKDFQEMFNVKLHKILKTASTRWLALENVVSRILEQWIPLKHYFISFGLENNDLAHKISIEMSDTSKLYFYFLAYILNLTNDINKEFQSQSPRIHLLLPTIECFMKTILSNFIKQEAIQAMDSNFNNIDFSRKEFFLEMDNVYLGGNAEILIRSGNLQESDIKTVKTYCINYYIELSQQIFKRINFKDQTLNALRGLNPECLDKTITTLISCFPNLISLDNGVAIETLDKEWRILINYSGIDKTLDLDEFWHCVFNVKNGLKEKMFPNLEHFIGAILCLPHSSATAERVFSQLNLIKDKKRNRLLVSTINAIMMAKENILNGLSTADWVPSNRLIKLYHKAN